MPKTRKRLGGWFKGYDDAPLWLCACRLIFAVSVLAFIFLFFGPAIFGGDLVGFWMFQDWALTHAGFLYAAAVVVTFTLAVVSGIPTIRHERKKMTRKLERGEVMKERKR